MSPGPGRGEQTWKKWLWHTLTNLKREWYPVLQGWACWVLSWDWKERGSSSEKVISRTCVDAQAWGGAWLAEALCLPGGCQLTFDEWIPIPRLTLPLFLSASWPQHEIGVGAACTQPGLGLQVAGMADTVCILPRAQWASIIIYRSHLAASTFVCLWASCIVWVHIVPSIRELMPPSTTFIQWLTRVSLWISGVLLHLREQLGGTQALEFAGDIKLQLLPIATCPYRVLLFTSTILYSPIGHL